MIPTELCFKWRDKEISIAIETSDTILALKHKLEEETKIPAKRQKLLGLKTREGKHAGDDVTIANLALKSGAKITLMGTPDEELLKAQQAAQIAPEVQDDFDIGPDEGPLLELKDHPDVQEKLERRIKNVKVEILNAPRPGKKCLVLDIDYTLFDLGSTAERPEELARPYLHEFLTACYEYYDILIWSATSMKWVEVKMKELGVIGNTNYKLVCLLDHAAMVTVQTAKYGVFDCKPLSFIWAKFSEFYNADNTVMLDDLRRNYVLNEQNGLVIRPFRKAHLTRHRDKELYYLTKYLTAVGKLEKLSHLNHRHWERYRPE